MFEIPVIQGVLFIDEEKIYCLIFNNQKTQDNIFCDDGMC